MARMKKETNEEESKPKKKKSGTLAERMREASGSKCATIISEDKYPIREYINTGNYMLNCLMNADPFGGIPTGRSIMFSGQKSVGKTFLSLEIMKNAQLNGYSGFIFDSEFSNNNNKDMSDRGLDTDNIVWAGIETIEETKTQVLNVLDEIESEDKAIFMIDSIGNLPSKKELEDSYSGSDKKDMTRPSALKSLFRTTTMPAGFKNVPILVINHVYANTGSFLPMDVVAGGGGPQYGVSISVIIAKSQLKDGDVVIGAKLKCKTDKNRLAKEKKTVTFTIDFDGGLSPTSGLLDYCYENEIFTPNKAVPKSGDIRKIKSWTYNGEEILTKDMNEEFWVTLLRGELGEILKKDFKYMSAKEELVDQEDQEEFEEAENNEE